MIDSTLRELYRAARRKFGTAGTVRVLIHWDGKGIVDMMHSPGDILCAFDNLDELPEALSMADRAAFVNARDRFLAASLAAMVTWGATSPLAREYESYKRDYLRFLP